MKLLKSLGLMLILGAFLVGFSTSAAYAQPGKAKWSGNQGKHKGWSKGKHKGWSKGKKKGWDNDYNRRWWERNRDQQRRRNSQRRNRTIILAPRYF